jgi:glycosyltransferase involved in cell wall biosynthesis
VLVGPAADAVRELAARPGVEVTGAVPDMAPWLDAADVVAVPMRWGSGTRIKILEAFAHGIPVVSSTIGAEGLDAVDGTHLLLAEGADAFADACRRLLSDASLRLQLATAARSLYLDRYRWEPIRAEIGALARRAASAATVETA